MRNEYKYLTIFLLHMQDWLNDICTSQINRITPGCAEIFGIYYKPTTVEALISGHPRDAKKVSVTGAECLREWFS